MSSSTGAGDTGDPLLGWCAVLGSCVCMGTFAAPMKFKAVQEANVHPLTFQVPVPLATIVRAAPDYADADLQVALCLHHLSAHPVASAARPTCPNGGVVTDAVVIAYQTALRWLDRVPLPPRSVHMECIPPVGTDTCTCTLARARATAHARARARMHVCACAFMVGSSRRGTAPCMGRTRTVGPRGSCMLGACRHLCRRLSACVRACMRACSRHGRLQIWVACHAANSTL